MSIVPRIAACLLLGLVSACASSSTEPAGAVALTAVPALDVPRYMGTWYEIAKFPNWFQAKCDSETSATYSLQPDATLQVVNRCRRASGEMDEALGIARQIGDETSPRLQVRFAPWWLSWIPSVWGNYWVVDLDAGYQLVAVSEPRREYLWILARSPQVDPGAYEALLGRLKAKGFDLARLEVTKH